MVVDVSATVTVKISSFNLNDRKMYDYYNLIQDYRPLAIRGYANALYEFAKFIDLKGLQIPNIENTLSPLTG